MTSSPIKRLGLIAAFISLGACALANSQSQQIKIDRAINSPTLAVKYNGVHAALIELRINGESMGTRTVEESATSGETTFTINVLSLKDGDNQIEIRLYDKKGKVVGSEKTVITTDSDTKGPVFLSTPKVGENVIGPCEISVGFGRDFKNSYVSFFVDNQFKSMMNFPPFTYNWDTSRETNGWHEVEAWIVDDTSATYKTRKVRVFVNNPGGRTFRPAPTATKAAIKPVSKLALPDTRTALKPTTNQVSAQTIGTSAPLKAMSNAISTASVAKTNAMIPSTVGFTTVNPVMIKLEGRSAASKATSIPQSTSVGPRLLTPTGKRTVPVKAENLASNPVAAIVDGNSASTKSTVDVPSQAAKAEATAMTPRNSKPNATEDDPGSVLALVPAAKTEAPATYHPLKFDATGEGMARPNATGSEPTAPIVPAAMKANKVTSVAMHSMGSTDSYVKPVKLYPNTPSSMKTLAKRMIPVDYGTRLPIKSEYTIEFAGSPVVFDVVPSIVQGVPVTPFRHLIEKSGGTIDWLADEHEVVATTDGRDIWLKIGDRYAKVDSLAVKLELAPFIKSGRTIVPLSFIKSALNVNVDYDKVTGHVLITPKGK